MKLTARAVLGLPEEAGPDAVREAYRRLAKLIHPDVNDNPAATEMMRIVNLAFEEAGTVAARPDTTPDPDDPCSTVVTFGKWDGWTIGALVQKHPWYVFWVTSTFAEGRWHRLFSTAILHGLADAHGETSARLMASMDAWDRAQ